MITMTDDEKADLVRQRILADDQMLDNMSEDDIEMLRYLSLDTIEYKGQMYDMIFEYFYDYAKFYL